ncbi:MAG: anthranilate phosphoribosyltransferase, partial [Chloroflexota bacterium]|nr:anthranilate phosphoribosyltransferase [Chloroflexota bacterium]
SISEPTTVFDVADGTVREYIVTPESVGLNRAPADAVRGGTVEANLRFARAVLGGEQGPARDVVLLNAAGGLVVSGLANDLEAGVQLAAEAIDSGRAREKVQQVAEVSQALKAQGGAA